MVYPSNLMFQARTQGGGGGGGVDRIDPNFRWSLQFHHLKDRIVC